MVAAGELPGKKASGRKKVQAEGGKVKREGGIAGAKRKQQGETADEESGVDTTAGEMPSPGPSSLPATGPTNIGATPAPSSTANPLVATPQMGRTPTVGGLQRELTDLWTLVTAVSATQDTLLSEVTMLRGWMEVLMTLKDDMLVKVPELQAEMRGLRNGMELERMKGEVAALQRELAATKAHLAKAPRPVPVDSSSSDGDSADESSGDNAQLGNLNKTPKTGRKVDRPS
jgi:hypothetical protein